TSFFVWIFSFTQNILHSLLSSLISIFLFTFIHVTHPIDFFMYAPGTILLTIAYLTANRSLAFIMAIHILNNVLGFVL
ncbi:type II CAAX prenyl endopeptidase Rce1 family protein, partial [Enterococcus lactis]|uniref:CPBP family glutamic-type intramembrane protease n=1 Tax=Enterococcus lactis TaxID=357441 RepID=UPI0022E20968